MYRDPEIGRLVSRVRDLEELLRRSRAKNRFTLVTFALTLVTWGYALIAVARYNGCSRDEVVLRPRRPNE